MGAASCWVGGWGGFSASANESWDNAARALLAGDRPALEQAIHAQSANDEAIQYAFGALLGSRLGGVGRGGATDREAYLEWMERRAGESRGWWRRQYLLALASDPQYRIRVLDRENRFNKFSRVFNRAVNSVTRLLMLQPGEAVAMVIDGTRGGLANRDATIRERLMAFEARRFLLLFPESPDAAEVQEMLAALDRRLAEDRARWYRERGQEAATRGQFLTARQYLALGPVDRETSTAIQRLDQTEEQRDQFGAQLVAAGGGDNLGGESARQARDDLARLLLAGEASTRWPAATSRAVGGASWGYAQSASLAARNELEASLRILKDLQDKSANSHEGRLAALHLANGSTNPEARWDMAMATLDHQRKRFALTGGRTATDTALTGASAAAQAGAGAGALFGTDIFFRSIAEGFRSRVDSNEAQDAAALYLRRLPQGTRAQEIRRALVDLEKRGGFHQEALDQLQQAPELAINDREPPRIRERQARDELVRALEVQDLPTRRALLQNVVSQWGDTPSGRRAQERLSQMPGGGEAQALGVVIPRTVLQGNPELAAQFGVPAEWVDRLRRNGELTAEGVILSADGRSVSMRTSTREAWHRVNFPEAGRETRMALAMQWGEAAVLEEETRGLLRRRRLPFGVEGGAGGSGVDIAPRLLPYEDTAESRRLFDR